MLSREKSAGNARHHEETEVRRAWAGPSRALGLAAVAIALAGALAGEAHGNSQRGLARRPAYNVFPAWSPDGREIAFVSNRDGNLEIYVMNADGSKLRRLTRNRVADVAPSWSPDGRQIAFQRRGDSDQIYVMNADGSGQHRLTQGAASRLPGHRMDATSPSRTAPPTLPLTRFT